MNYDDILGARRNAESAIRFADEAAKGAAMLAAGRLRQGIPNPDYWSADRDALTKLKRELRDFDMRTGRWKQSP